MQTNLKKRSVRNIIGIFATGLMLHTPGAQADAPKRTPREIIAEIVDDQKNINTLLGKNNQSIKEESDRSAVAPKLLPLLNHVAADIAELRPLAPGMDTQLDGIEMQTRALLVALGDQPATDQIKALLGSADPTKVITATARQLLTKFYLTDNTLDAQTSMADEVDRLDRAHPTAIPLTQATIEMSHDQALPAIRQRLETIATSMQNQPAAVLRQQLADDKAAADQDAQLANKPITLSGQLVDGKDFSTQSLKGKVILVDFWATWCGPCKAELPRIKKMYDEYHNQGLEVVGISNDYDADALKDFIAATGLPWAQLFDPASAAAHKMHPITVDQKIDGIPVLYLIDKNGILRTVNARSNMEKLIPELLAK